MSAAEVAGFITGLAGVYLTIRENPWCFPVGIINVTISLFLFAGQQLYSDALQQVVYILLLAYGWYKWKFVKTKTTLHVTQLSFNWIAILIPVTLLVAVILGYMFATYTDANFPYLDAGATAMSFTAQFLIARKKIENWYIWMVVNVVYVGIYINKELYLYMALFIIYFFLAVMGYRQWRRHLEMQLES